MSPVEFKKTSCRPVDFKGQAPFFVVPGRPQKVPTHKINRLIPLIGPGLSAPTCVMPN